jgi:hypothetical protein
MSENKTIPNNKDLFEFLNEIEGDLKKSDCKAIYEMMKDIMKCDGVMWGESIIGFGQYHYKYDSGREGDYFLTGFSPRKNDITIYIMDGFSNHKNSLEKLGKHKSSVSCLYIKKLEDINLDVLRDIIQSSTERMKLNYP